MGSLEITWRTHRSVHTWTHIAAWSWIHRWYLPQYHLILRIQYTKLTESRSRTRFRVH